MANIPADFAEKVVLAETFRGVTVKIYPETKPSGTYYRVCDYSSGIRKFISKPTEEAARSEALRIAKLMAKGDAEGARMTGKDRQELQLIRDALKESGVNPVLAATQFAEARKVLCGRPLIDAARYYVKTHPIGVEAKTVQQVADEFLAAKTKEKKSGDYLVDCRYRHGKFAAAFNCNIAEITGDQINGFLDALGLSDRSRNNFRLSINTLFEFAREKKYLPTDWDSMASVKRINGDEEGEITIFTPGEMQSFLSRSRTELIPFLAIGAFAGLRSAEIERLTWEDVFTIPGKIEVKAKKAKTRSRRLVPVLPNLAKWLEPFKGKTGPVMPFADIGLQLRELCAKQGDLPALTWKRNALRHSFISYRLAAVQSAAQVALEAGNSETMIFKNYREIVTAEAAQEWFGISPAQARDVSNVIQLLRAA